MSNAVFTSSSVYIDYLRLINLYLLNIKQLEVFSIYKSFCKIMKDKSGIRYQSKVRRVLF